MLRRPFIRQPTHHVGVDTYSKMANGLVLAYNAATNSDAVSGAGSATSLQRVAARGYTAISASGTQSATFNGELYNVVGDITVLAFLNMNGLGGAYMLSKNNANGDGADPTPIQFGPNASQIVLNRSTSGGFRVWTSAVVPTGSGEMTVAASQVAAIGTPPRFYLNGVFDTGAATNNFSGSASSATGNNFPLRIGNRGNLSAGFGGYIYAVFMWSRVLDDVEVMSMHRNPWQLFRPIARSPRLFSLPAARVGSSLIVKQSVNRAYTY